VENTKLAKVAGINLDGSLRIVLKALVMITGKIVGMHGCRQLLQARVEILVLGQGLHGA